MRSQSARRRPTRALRSLTGAAIAGAAVFLGLSGSLAVAATSAPVTLPAAADASTPAAPATASTPTKAADPASPGLTWKTSSPPTSPPPLAYAAAAYDADNSTVVMFGGITSDGTLSSATWVWNGTTWKKSGATTAPPKRELASMAFDPTLHQLILFGGQGDNGSLLGDTWAWNGASWIQLAVNGPAPGPREAAAMAYERSGSLLLFGGTGSSSTQTTSTSTSLPGLTPSQAPPPETSLNDTWLWTAAGWVHSSAAGPSARSGAAMAYDQADGTTVLFGGEATTTSTPAAAPLADTWVWNGSGWTAAKPSSSPPARFGAAAGVFPGLGGSLLVAGEGSAGGLGDGWVWTGGGWTQATMQGSASPRIGAAAAYDAASQSLLVFGGIGNGGATLGDTGLVSMVPSQTPPTTTGHPTTTTTDGPTPSTSAPPGTPTTKPTTSTSHRTVTTSSTTTVAPGGGGVALPGSPTLQTDHAQVQRGDSVELTGAGFAPGSVVTLTFHSAPALLGTAVVALNGTFTKVVTIPDGAAPGEHHFVATGRTTSGVTADLTAAITVLVPHHKGISTVAKLALVGLALLIPVAAYLGMAGAGVWRRHRQHKPA